MVPCHEGQGVEACWTDGRIPRELHAGRGSLTDTLFNSPFASEIVSPEIPGMPLHMLGFNHARLSLPRKCPVAHEDITVRERGKLIEQPEVRATHQWPLLGANIKSVTPGNIWGGNPSSFYFVLLGSYSILRPQGEPCDGGPWNTACPELMLLAGLSSNNSAMRYSAVKEAGWLRRILLSVSGMHRGDEGPGVCVWESGGGVINTGRALL